MTRIWIVTFIFFGSTMLAGGVARVVMPWMKKDIERYLVQLGDLFKTTIGAVVAIAATEAAQGRPCLPPARTPHAGNRPSGKPGASRTRQRSRTRR